MRHPDSDVPRLFEKFYRGTNREALAQRGTGLGIAIVKSIAERHSGKVWVESELTREAPFICRSLHGSHSPKIHSIVRKRPPTSIATFFYNFLTFFASLFTPI